MITIFHLLGFIGLLNGLSVFQELEGLMPGYEINMPEPERHVLLAQFRAKLPDNMRVRGGPQ